MANDALGQQARQQSLGDNPRRTERRVPDKIAIIDGQTTLTFRELDEAVDRMAAALADAGFVKGDRLALLSHKGTSMLKTKVTTTDGKVRVMGDAASAAEKSLVTKLASDVRGVKSVDNDMPVKD